MHVHRRQFIGVVGTAMIVGCSPDESEAAAQKFEFTLTDAEWRKRLTPAQYRILRQEGTERAGTSPLNTEKRAGIFSCAGCGLPLYSSKTKYDSGTGWPSFWQPLNNAVRTKSDFSLADRQAALHQRAGAELQAGLTLTSGARFRSRTSTGRPGRW